MKQRVALVFLNNNASYLTGRIGLKYAAFDYVYIVEFVNFPILKKDVSGKVIHLKVPYPNIVRNLKGMNREGLKIYAKRIMDLLLLNGVLNLQDDVNDYTVFYSNHNFALIAAHIKAVIGNKQVLFCEDKALIDLTFDPDKENNEPDSNWSLATSFIQSSDLVICSSMDISDAVKRLSGGQVLVQNLPQHSYIEFGRHLQLTGDSEIKHFIERLNINNKKSVLFYSSGEMDQKGLMLFLEAINSVVKVFPELQVLICGEIDYKVCISQYPFVNANCAFLGDVGFDIVLYLANIFDLVLSLPGQQDNNLFLFDLAVASSQLITTKEFDLESDFPDIIEQVVLEESQRNTEFLSAAIIRRLNSGISGQKINHSLHLNHAITAFNEVLVAGNILQVNDEK